MLTWLIGEGRRVFSAAPKTLHATVVEVLDANRVVIDRGAARGITMGTKFMIFTYGDMVHDYETGAELGPLTVVRGQGEVTALQQHTATITSTGRSLRRRKLTFDPHTMPDLLPGETVVAESDQDLPFLDARVGDHAQPL